MDGFEAGFILAGNNKLKRPKLFTVAMATRAKVIKTRRFVVLKETGKGLPSSLSWNRYIQEGKNILIRKIATELKVTVIPAKPSHIPAISEIRQASTPKWFQIPYLKKAVRE